MAESKLTSEQLAQDFREIYEILAAKPWEPGSRKNRALMTAVCAEIIERYATSADKDRVNPAMTELLEILKDALKGCQHCEYDEAEGGLVNHCDTCCRKVTAMLWEHFHKDAK